MKIKQTIERKLALSIMLFNIVSILLVSFLFYDQFREALNERVLLQLTSIKRLKRTQIVSFLQEKISLLEKVTPTLLADPLLSQYIAPQDTLILLDTADNQIFIPGLSDSVEMPPGGSQHQVTIRDLTSLHEKGEITLMFVRHLNPSQNIVLVTQGEEIQEILYERTGMGETGESYLVGEDTTLRSVSRFYPSLPPPAILANPVTFKKAKKNLAEAGRYHDYRSVQVFSSFSPINVHGLHWIILSEIDQEEAMLPLYQLRNTLVSICMIILLVVLLVGILLARNLVRPVVQMKVLLSQMATGKPIPQVPTPTQGDEIAQMYIALNKLIEALNRITQYADEIGNGNFDVNYALLSQNDTLGLSLLRMRDQLKAYQKNEAKLLKQSQRALMQGQEKERMRLAQELHDGLGPLLTTLKLSLQSATQDASQQEKIRKLLDETITEVRNMSHNLMPSVLLDFGVGEAIGNLVAALQKVTTINIKYSNDMQQESSLTDEVNIQLYRIAQEALNNAVKYSQATEIKLSVTEFEDHVSFYISDNGIGFDVNKPHNGTGLINLRERTKLLNGSFEIHADSHGTSIEIELPLHHELH